MDSRAGRTAVSSKKSTQQKLRKPVCLVGIFNNARAGPLLYNKDILEVRRACLQGD